MKLLYRVYPLLAVYIPQTFVVWWAGLDSNQRIPKEWNLQSHAIAAMRPTHIEAEGWHRHSISLTALLFCCFWLASRSYRLLFDNTAYLHLLTHRSLAGVAGFEPANAGVWRYTQDLNSDFHFYKWCITYTNITKSRAFTTWLHPNISQFLYLTR